MRISDWSSDVCSSDLVRAEQADAITGRDQQFEAAENRCLAVAGGDLVEPHQRRRQSLRHRKTERELGVRVDRGDQLHALQRLDAALRLRRPAGLGLEAANEILQVRDLALMLVVMHRLQGQALGALTLELRVDRKSTRLNSSH